MSEAPGAPPADAVLRRILRNAGLVLGGKATGAVLNLAAFGIAMRSLGPEAMGLLVLTSAIAQTAPTLVKFQSWQAVLRFGTGCLEPARRAEFHALLRFTVGLDLAAALAGSALGAAAALVLGPSLGLPAELTPLAALYATCSIFMVTATPIGLLRLFDRFDILARRDAMGAAIRLAGAAGAAAMADGLPAFLAAWWAATVLGGLVVFAAAWGETARRGLLRRDPAGRRVRVAAAHPGIWGFAWSTNLMTTLALGSGRAATLCVGWMLGPAEAALFALARQVGEAALKPSRFLTPALYPELSRLAAADDREGLRALLRRGLRLSAAVAAGFLLVLAVAGGWLLRLVGGEPAMAASGTMLLLAAAASIGFAGFALEPLLVSVGRHAHALRLRLVATAAYLPLCLAGLFLFGLEGAGLAAIVSALQLLLGQAVLVRRWLGGDTGRSPGV